MVTGHDQTMTVVLGAEKTILVSPGLVETIDVTEGWENI
jgi:hypothetical protein